MRTHSAAIRCPTPLIAASAVFLFCAGTCSADPFFFSTGNPNNLMATASRPDVGAFEIESADDFVLTHSTTITSATFTGLIVSSGPAVPTLGQIVVEIYRVFPTDSDVGRTSGPPTFSTSQVPTRVNSPSDVALDTRDSSVAGQLSFTTTELSASFTALNSVQPGGIHPIPNQQTLGNGAVTGEELQFNITFTSPFLLSADHYFFVPQVEVTGGTFLWLSAPKPIVPPGTPFPAGSSDLQEWTRDAFLDPDWLRVGTDIVGTGAFNATFSLTGTTPEPGTVVLVGAGLLAVWWWRRKTKR